MEDLLTYAEASKHLNIKLGTLYALVSEERVPRAGRGLSCVWGVWGAPSVRGERFPNDRDPLGRQLF